ncbi:MAG: glycyl-radical enzyme activating protein [Clostridia bacterium]|nr:glycyl-radical enzyme activating protein [Clostridia bacterium]
MALITNIQRFSVHDGPGIRTTVFLKGCPLHCEWCHNPETQRFERECGELGGREYTAREVFEIVKRDEAFYINSGGGVTFGGGEPMAQADFLCEALRLCREDGLHCAVDTSGFAPFEDFERALKLTDLFLFDIKHPDNEAHKRFTGEGNSLILDNLRRLCAAGAAVRIRVPVIVGVNADEAVFYDIAKILREYRLKAELLPYHAYGVHKYAALGREYKGGAFCAPSDEAMAHYRSILEGLLL